MQRVRKEEREGSNAHSQRERQRGREGVRDGDNERETREEGNR